MNRRPERLQGTDGIRGTVAAPDDDRLAGTSPIEAFLEHRLISSALVELYCYAFVLETIESGLAKAGDEFVVGFDPRDRDRRLVRAAVDGIAKAGGVPVNIGVMPTPGVGMYMVGSGAGGAVAITASHNPAEQNGIKLFMPGGGLKPFPADDRRLTARLYSLEGEDLAGIQPKHQAMDRSAEAGAAFREFFDAPRNTWVAEQGGAFGNTMLVVDCSNGALARLAPGALQGLGFGDVEAVGCSLSARINDNCGAGLLEGHGVIGPDFVSDAGGDFRSVELIQALFRHGRSMREQIERGERRVSGAAFDGDGDRFYRLEYDPYRDAVLVISGDVVAYHQAWFIRRHLGEDYNEATAFATTVESDINVSVAAEELGFIPVVTAVGDKWLLWEAACHQLGSCWELINNNSTDLDLLRKIEEREGEFAESGEADARMLVRLQREAEGWAKQNGIDLGELMLDAEVQTFAIGGEETGHTVTAGCVKTPEGGQRVVYFGNALKSAINLFVATDALAGECGGEEYYRRLQYPYPPGHKRTYAAYYTERGRLASGSEVYREIEERLLRGAEKRFGGRLKAELRPRSEEPDMIYLALSDREGEVTRAAAFVRNSGTEEKTSVYVVGDKAYAEDLDALGGEVAATLTRLMKRSVGAYPEAELAVLRRIGERGPTDLKGLADLLGGVDPQRLLLEMSIKQKMLRAEGDRLALTDYGRQVLEEMK